MTAEGSDGVDALTVTTQIRHHLALVDVWKRGEITEDAQPHRETQHSAPVTLNIIKCRKTEVKSFLITERLTSAISGVARTEWAHLLVLYGARQRAKLAL